MVDDLTPPEEGVLTLRVSDIRTWLQCPRKFYLTVMEGLYPQNDQPGEAEAQAYRQFDPDNPEAVLSTDVVIEQRDAKRSDEGTMVHAVAEQYYKGKITLENRRQEVVDIVTAKTQQLTPDPLARGWPKAMEYATVMALGYLQWIAATGHDAGKKPLMVEQRLTMNFPVSKAGYHTVRLTGQPDLVEVDQTTNEIGIGDHKTAKDLFGGPRANDFQLTAYALLYANREGIGVPISPSYGYQNLIKRSLQTASAAPPFYRRVPMTFTSDKLTQFHKFIEIQIDAILNAIEIVRKHDVPEYLPYSETLLCVAMKMCNVVPLCDAMSSGSPVLWKEMANADYGGNYGEQFDD